jgi:hypothetical protein
MWIEAYLRVLGREETVRAIHEATNRPNAEIKETEAPIDPLSKEMWWNWQTSRAPIDIDNTDDGLKKLLLAHRQIFPIIRRFEETDIYLEVVMQYKEGEEPWGLHLSAETVTLLSEMGGDLDVDAVTPVEKSQDS